MAWKLEKERINEIIDQNRTSVIIKHKYAKSILPESGLTDNSAKSYIQKIGDCLAGPNDPRHLGRTIWKNAKEEMEIMSTVISFPQNATLSDVSKLLNDYWASFSERIPYEGRELNLAKDEYGAYIKPYDYVLYRYCLFYPHVAKSKNEVNNSPKIRFYIEDKAEETVKNINHLRLKDEATTLKAAMLSSNKEEDKKAVNAIIYLLNNYNVPKSDNDKYLLMTKFAEENPEDFIEYAKNPEIKMLAFLQQCVNAARINNPIGTTLYYINGDNGQITLGRTAAEAISYLKLPENKTLLDSLLSHIKSIPK